MLMALLAEENYVEGKKKKRTIQASGNKLMFPTVWELVWELCMTNSAKNMLSLYSF